MILRSFVKDTSQISAQDLELVRGAQAALSQRERSKGPAFGVDELCPGLGGVVAADFIEEAHLLHDGDGAAADVDVLAGGAHGGHLLEDSDGVAVAGEPPGECWACYPGSADEDSHVGWMCGVESTNVVVAMEDARDGERRRRQEVVQHACLCDREGHYIHGHVVAWDNAKHP